MPQKQTIIKRQISDTGLSQTPTVSALTNRSPLFHTVIKTQMSRRFIDTQTAHTQHTRRQHLQGKQPLPHRARMRSSWCLREVQVHGKGAQALV